MIKSLGMMALLAFAGLAAVAAAPAAATTYHIESCMESEECKTASVGTTFESTAEEYVLKNEKKEVVDECKMTLKGKVVDSTTEKKEDEMETSITSVKLTECTVGELVPEGLPWKVQADAPGYESTGAFEVRPLLMKTAWLGCKYELDGIIHTILEKMHVLNRNLYTFGDGELGNEEKPTLFCGSLLEVTYTEITQLISDPNLSGAVYMDII